MLSTAQKVWIAGIIARVLIFVRQLVGRGPTVNVRRRGILWELDLREGVDFSLYIMGVFEPESTAPFRKYIKPGSTVLDIGANIGAHTLPMARLAGPLGKVFAFEPTVFAYRKLMRNIELNADLAARIDAHQMFLAGSDEWLEERVYSSWPLLGDPDPGSKHPFHCGQLMSVAGARTTTLDEFAREKAIERLDFVKLDVDGNEWKVLSGARETFLRHRPVLFIEFASYLFDKSFWEFEAVIKFLADIGYTLTDAESKIVYPLDGKRIRAMIPEGRSRNVIGTV